MPTSPLGSYPFCRPAPADGGPSATSTPSATATTVRGSRMLALSLLMAAVLTACGGGQGSGGTGAGVDSGGWRGRVYRVFAGGAAMLLSRVKQRHAQSGIDPADELKLSEGMNSFLYKVMQAEVALIKAGINLPIGGSRLVVAKRREWIST